MAQLCSVASISGLLQQKSCSCICMFCTAAASACMCISCTAAASASMCCSCQSSHAGPAPQVSFSRLVQQLYQMCMTAECMPVLACKSRFTQSQDVHTACTKPMCTAGILHDNTPYPPDTSHSASGYRALCRFLSPTACSAPLRTHRMPCEYTGEVG